MIKKCKVCGKLLAPQNKSMLCSHHYYHTKYQKKYMREKKKNALSNMSKKN